MRDIGMANDGKVIAALVTKCTIVAKGQSGLGYNLNFPHVPFGTFQQ